MADLPKAPAKNIKYGMLQPQCEEALQLGYDYGRDSAEEDATWES